MHGLAHMVEWNADRLQLTAAEMSAIASSFNDKGEPKAVISNGVKVNGEKYMTIESTDDSLKAKKVRHQRYGEVAYSNGQH